MLHVHSIQRRLYVFSHLAGANQADDTTITINGHTAGATPFISKLTLTGQQYNRSEEHSVHDHPKPGSVTRPLSGTYANHYLVNRGFEHPQGEIILPVYGLYAGYTNTVTTDLSVYGRFFKASCHHDHDRHFR